MRASATVVVLLLAAGAGGVPKAAAQDSVFGIRGLGFLDRTTSAGSAGEAGALSLVDGASPQNPAAAAAWHGTAGWALAASSARSFDDGTGPTSLRSTRFPLFGFSSPLGPRWVVGVMASDYMDRNWQVTQTDTVTPRGSPVVANDVTQSLGGITDLQMAVAYRVPHGAVGLAVHELTGAVQTGVLRTFPADSSFVPFSLKSETNFLSVGVALGALISPVRTMALAASVRFNGRLRATTVDTVVHVGMPLEANVGLTFQPVTGLSFATSVGYATWGNASADLEASGRGSARDVWDVRAGLALGLLRLGRSPVPLRAGFWWRQLPFPVGGAALTERGLAAGFGLTGAGGRATVDLAIQAGSRAAGALKERFTMLMVGLIVRP